MDYVPAHGNTNRLADRDDISGVRVLDGEDQGKQDRSLSLSLSFESSIFRTLFPDISDPNYPFVYRCR